MSRLFYAIFALSLTSALADPITANRLKELPAAEQPAWKAYWEHSIADAKRDQSAVEAEVAANKMTNAVRAPSGGDFHAPTAAGDPWYSTDEAKHLADIILSYQTPSGGWSKHLGFNKGKRLPGMQWTSQNEPGQPAHYVATFDNGSTTEEMHFLANVWQATKRDDCKVGFSNGLKFIFAAQFPNGGWPQVYPLEGGYHDDITFNDNAMTHVLELLSAITRNEPCYAFLNDSQRQQAATALAAGIRNVLKMQLVQNGKKTVWCAQFDSLTLQPVGARKMEPGTLSGSESSHILEFLMTLTNPAPEIVASIESGLAWFENAKITGLKKANVNGKTAYEPDSASTEVYWARFYDLTTGKPVFPGRDGIVYPTFAEMAAKNKLGYDYYTTHPGSLLNTHQKKWRKMLGAKIKSLR
jgi:PelA/Pel-15E family pectate lyase